MKPICPKCLIAVNDIGIVFLITIFNSDFIHPAWEKIIIEQLDNKTYEYLDMGVYLVTISLKSYPCNAIDEELKMETELQFEIIDRYEVKNDTKSVYNEIKLIKSK